MNFKHPAHSYALQIESTLRKVFNQTDRGGFGGIADADFCERKPYVAMTAALATKYKGTINKEIDEFISSYYWDIGKSISDIGENEINKAIEKFDEIMEK